MLNKISGLTTITLNQLCDPYHDKEVKVLVGWPAMSDGSGEVAPAKSQEELRKQQGRFCSQITVIK